MKNFTNVSARPTVTAKSRRPVRKYVTTPVMRVATTRQLIVFAMLLLWDSNLIYHYSYRNNGIIQFTK